MRQIRKRISNPHLPPRNGGKKRVLLAGIALAAGLGFLMKERTPLPVQARPPAAIQTAIEKKEKEPLPKIGKKQGEHAHATIPASRAEPKAVEEWKKIAQRARKIYLTKKHVPLPEKKIDEICQIVSFRKNVDSALLKAFFKVESDFDPEAVGPTLDIGAGQLSPIVLAELHQKGMPIGNPFDPIQNLTGVAIKIWDFQRIAKWQTSGNPEKGFSQYERRYEYEGKKTTFDRLPNEIQIGIIASMYNRGPGNTFTTENSTKNGYDAQHIAQFNYSQKIIRWWKEYGRGK